MKRLFYVLCLMTVLVSPAGASHLLGGELYYTHVTGRTYEVTLALYGDCAGAAFPSFATSDPLIRIYDGTSQIDSFRLALDAASGNEITPVCPAMADSTNCSIPGSPIQGVKRFEYNAVYTFPGNSANYGLVFYGNMATGGGSSAGRSQAITNIQPNQSSILYLVAELNNLSGANSSPRFTTIPTPFYCINQTQEYNQGALDQDNDSLAYALSPALEYGVSASYRPGYSATQPLSTYSGMFDFNPLNGQMSFMPNQAQSSVVVNKVYEYRNGQIIGSCMREMTFVVLDFCDNMPPGGELDTGSIVGGIAINGNVFNVCRTTNLVSFSVPLSDPDQDTVDVTNIGVPPGASLHITGNGGTSPVMHFSWNTANVDAGVYNFFVTLKDRHCPLNTVSTKGFTIRIVDSNKISHKVLRPTNCANRAILEFRITDGLLPRTLRIMQGASLIRTIQDTTGVVVDSLLAGSYELQVSSAHLLCPTVYPFQVVDSGVFPFKPLFNQNILCIGNDPSALPAIAFPGATVHWFDSLGNPLSGAPIPNTSATGSAWWLLSQRYKVCESVRDTARVNIVPNPEARVLNKTGLACVGDQVFLLGDGGVTYTWLPEDRISLDANGRPFIRVYEPSEYALVAADSLGCRDTVRFGFTNIEPCCSFSFPTAFTPNGDGRNEGWRPVLYGNNNYYELSIYNRWGERLFHSFTANEAWDGRYQGTAQDVGVYFYALRARCLTGKEETRQGEFTLLR